MSSSAPPSAVAPPNSPGLGRWGVLLGAIIVQLILGTVYGYSIFWQPLQAEVFPPVVTRVQSAQLQATGQDLAKYVVVADDAEAARTRDQQQSYLKFAFAICILSFAVVMVVAGRVQDLLGPRIPAIIGAVLMAVGFVSAAYMSSPIVLYIAHAGFAGVLLIVLLMINDALLGKVDHRQVPVVRHVPLGVTAAVVVAAVLLANRYVGHLGEWDKLFLLWGTIGFLAGAGIGFAYVCPIAALVKWFPKQKGLVSGVAVAGFGLGAFIFSRPELDFSARRFIETNGIIKLFLVHGLICLVFITLGALLLRNPPGTPPKTAPAESTWQDTLRRPAFYVLWGMFFSGALAGLMVIGIVSPFVAGQLGGGAEAAAAGAKAVGVLSIFNALGRVLWGLTSDRIGRTPTFIVMFLIQAVVMFLLANLESAAALYVAAGLVGFNFGGNFALFPSATADLFGAKNLGANYGWVFTSYGVAGVVGIYAGNIAKTQTGSYRGAFVLAAVLCLLSVVLAIGLRRSQGRKAAA